MGPRSPVARHCPRGHPILVPRMSGTPGRRLAALRVTHCFFVADEEVMHVGRRVYVSNLAWRTSWQDLKDKCVHGGAIGGFVADSGKRG